MSGSRDLGAAIVLPDRPALERVNAGFARMHG